MNQFKNDEIPMKSIVSKINKYLKKHEYKYAYARSRGNLIHFTNLGIYDSALDIAEKATNLKFKIVHLNCVELINPN